jgi:hypothetical protein
MLAGRSLESNDIIPARGQTEWSKTILLAGRGGF